MDLKQPRSPCVLPTVDPPHRPRSHQWSICLLSDFWRQMLYFLGSHSTGDKAFLTCSLANANDLTECPYPLWTSWKTKWKNWKYFWGIGIGPDKECWPHGPSWRAGFLWEALKLCAEEYFANNKTSKGQRTKCREQLTNLRQSGDAAICPSSISFIVHWYSAVQWSTFQRCWEKGRKCEKVFTSNREDWTKLG